MVKHGNTFCTVAQFADVAKAIGEYAFRTSQLPLSLSLEVTLAWSNPCYSWASLSQRADRVHINHSPARLTP